jgi:hypothetical protein
VGGLAFADQQVNLLESFLLDPNLPATGTDLGGEILEEIELITASFLVGDCGRARAPSAYKLRNSDEQKIPQDLAL